LLFLLFFSCLSINSWFQASINLNPAGDNISLC
jgi:hypothetical protein